MVQTSNNRSAGSDDFSKKLTITFLTIAFFGVAAWMVIPGPSVGFYWDDTWYLLMAEWLNPDSSYRDLSWVMMQVTSYPPLFPLFISWSGASLADQQPAFIMNAMFLALGCGVSMLWFVREGFSSVAFVFAAVFMLLNPVSLGYLPILYSEFLFILLSVSALLFAHSLKDWKWSSNWLLIGIIVGLAVATRSAGWSLAAAFLVHLGFARKFTSIAAFVVGLSISVLVIPFLMVGLPSSGNYLELLSGNLSNIGWNFILYQAHGLVLGWNMLWGWGPGAWFAIAMVLPGLFVRVRANRADAWYVLAYFVMLMVWPFPGHMGRFLWPLLPCFLVSIYSTFDLFRGLEKSRPLIISVVMGLVFAASVPDGIGRSLQRLVNPPDGDLSELSRMQEWTRSASRDQGMMMLRGHQQFLKDLQQIDEIVDGNDCIYSEIPSLVVIQTRQASYEPPWKTLEDARTQNFQCRYYYMLPPALPDAGIEDVNRFSQSHQEFFRVPHRGYVNPSPLGDGC